MDQQNTGQVPVQDDMQQRPDDTVEHDAEQDEYEQVDAPDEAVESTEPTFTWQASEYVHHHKGAGWYAVLAAVVILLTIVAIIFKFWLSIGVFIAMGAAVAVYAHKPPRVLTYELDAYSVTIEGKVYPYKNFRSFGVVSEDDWHTIDLEPTQRFMPRLTVLFGDDDFDAIVGHLTQHLPRYDREPDFIERATRYLRF